ncbi:ABC transporter permease [Gordonia sp. TBRC 11910]|uniref:ABC transporter permease n=1 Tax=Gordonia asplenii TaxID=2725283 RepID=A0A848KPZ4_9ACTN|nr:ABC transporter permease [Gordonia asplenii]NMO00746.1 ABC transporter permease [Gordonia asplenii]
MRASTIPTAVVAESIRTGGRRGVVWTIGVPAAVLSGLLITMAVAIVAEQFAAIGAASANPASIQVTSATTPNAVYWIITFTVTIGAITAAYAQASAMREPADDLERFSYVRSWTAPIARWLYYGTVTAVVSSALVVCTLLTLPRAFPLVYGGVELMSDAGLRFVWAVPLYGFGACGFGIGLAAVIANPAGAIALLLGWMYVVETAITLVPNGYQLQSYLPFLNGVYGTGQELALQTPWSRNSALAFFVAVSALVFAVGLLRLSRRRR